MDANHAGAEFGDGGCGSEPQLAAADILRDKKTDEHPLGQVFDAVLGLGRCLVSPIGLRLELLVDSLDSGANSPLCVGKEVAITNLQVFRCREGAWSRHRQLSPRCRSSWPDVALGVCRVAPKVETHRGMPTISEKTLCGPTAVRPSFRP